MAQRPENYLLRQLPEAAFELLRCDLRPVHLQVGEALYEPDQPIDRVIFPESGLLSIVTIMLSGAMAETSMVGRDGGVGFVEASGSGRIFSCVMVQVGGVAWSAPASRYREAYESSKLFRVAIQANIELQIAEGRQTLACNSLHKADQRLARWLLDCHELSGCGNVLPLTQEFLSAMVSVQRSTISNLTSEFESEGLVRQRRGRIELLDLPGLERRSCECRATIARLRQSIQPGALAANAAASGAPDDRRQNWPVRLSDR